MAVSASLVKELRERTGAGMMDCRRALEASSGDIKVAIEAMRKSGQAKAAKKANRIAAEGVLVVKHKDEHEAAMVEINCETDFVARDESFITFAEKLAQIALHQRSSDILQLQGVSFADDKTVEQAREALVAKIGENIQLRRAQYVKTADNLTSYVHGAGRIAVLVDMKGGNADLRKDIAMHIAAMNPKAVRADDVPAELLEKEKEIFSAQAKQTGKPDEIVEKMVAGRLNKFLKEVSLEGQPFVRDPSQTVDELLKKHQATVNQFFRFEVGEGIEKEETNFAEEVKTAAQSI